MSFVARLRPQQLTAERLGMRASISRRMGGAAAAVLWPLSTQHAQADQTITVSNATELLQAVSAANQAGGGSTIMLRDGVYTVPSTLSVQASNVTLTSVSGMRDRVIVEGNAMSATATAGDVVRVTGK